MTDGAAAVQIREIVGLGHLATVLGAWHHDEWGYLYSPEVWDRATAVREFETMATPGATDRTWIAVAAGATLGADAIDADALLGSVSLLATDDLEGFEHLSPWLASMYVAPAARGRGVAALLMDALLDGARDAGHQVVHLFTAGQRAFWAERGWSSLAEVTAEGHPATVMARSTDRRSARRAVRSNWCGDPDFGGAYSHLRAGATPAARQRLAEQIVPGLWFAGEATSVAHPATMHGAWFSGERAANEVLAVPNLRRVAVVGAGLAGIAAARRLVGEGGEGGEGGDDREVVLFESKEIVGGRVRTDRSTGAPLPLGGTWLHGDEGHPLREMVTSIPDDWEHPGFFAVDHGRLTDDEVDEVRAVYGRLHDAFVSATPEATVADVTAAVLDREELAPLIHDTVLSWVTSECEGLFGAPMYDISASVGLEDFELPGGDHLVTSDLGALVQQLADGLDVRARHRVSEIRNDSGRWTLVAEAAADSEADYEADNEADSVEEVFDAVIVTVPILVLAAGRLRFAPPLPDDVVASIASLGAGPITKVFATFDEAWWPQQRLFRLARTSAFGAVLDVSELAGRPVLLAFAVGDAALRVERLDEHELCRLVDLELSSVGLTDWDA